MSRTHQEFLAEAAAAIPQWLAFLDRMEAEQDALLAQVRGPARPPTAAAAPMPEPSGDVDEAIMTWAPIPDGSAGEAAPSREAHASPAAPSPSPSPAKPGTLAARFGSADLPGATEPPSELGAHTDQLPPDRPESVEAFEAALAATGAHELPVQVTDAMQWETDDPQALPKALVAAQRRGDLPPTLDEAVTRMIESDFHFAEAADEAAGEQGVA